MTKIKFCKKCGQYTLQDRCQKCGIPTVNPEPAKYNPKDKYGKERRLYKREIQTSR